MPGAHRDADHSAAVGKGERRGGVLAECSRRGACSRMEFALGVVVVIQVNEDSENGEGSKALKSTGYKNTISLFS